MNTYLFPDAAEFEVGVGGHRMGHGLGLELRLGFGARLVVVRCDIGGVFEAQYVTSKTSDQIPDLL
eukprot:1348536-Amorphochlora_amoeboformis.AAC.1